VTAPPAPAPALPPASRPLPLWLVLAAPGLAFLLATGLNYGGQAITGPDEPRYAAAARDMLRTGDWTVPVFNGRPRLEKPILIYWGCAFFSLLFGVGPLACRLGPVLAGLGTVLVCAALGARLYGRRAGLLAGMVLATSWLFAQYGRTVLCDMPLTFFVTASIALLRIALDEARPGRRRLLLLAAYLSAGLGVLAKGPLGLLLPVGVMAAWLAWEGRGFAVVRLKPLSGAAVALLLAAPWHLCVHWRGGEAAAGLGDFFRVENYARYFHSFDHLGRPWRYLTVSVPQGMVPWTFLLPAGALAFWKLARKAPKAGRPAGLIELAFPMVWAGAIVGFFSATGQLGPWPWIALAAFLLGSLCLLWMLGRERHWKWTSLAAFCLFALAVAWPGGAKRSFYVLAAYPALAIAAGWALDRAAAHGGEFPWLRRLAEAVPVAIGLVLVLVAAAAGLELLCPGASPLAWPVSNIAEYRAQPGFRPLLVALLVAGGGLGAAALVLATRKGLVAAVLAAALGLAALEGCYWGRAIPLRDRVCQIGVLYRRAAPRMADRSAPVLTCDVPATAEAVYYLDRPVRKVRARGRGSRSLRRAIEKRAPLYLVISEKCWARQRRRLKARAREVARGRRKRENFLVLALDGARIALPRPSSR